MFSFGTPDTVQPCGTIALFPALSLYIDNTLYTVSEEEIKANDLETLEEIKEVMFN